VVLVDGYNVARTAWPALTPEEERIRLIAALEELHARTGADITVVFDGVQAGGPIAGQASRTVRVRFTAEGVSADDVVRNLVGEFPPHRPVVVVSSDREVAEGAGARGANAVSSRQFLSALGR
jgi:predicted RNA-binding protein with PIN domain